MGVRTFGYFKRFSGKIAGRRDQAPILRELIEQS